MHLLQEKIPAKTDGDLLFKLKQKKARLVHLRKNCRCTFLNVRLLLWQPKQK